MDSSYPRELFKKTQVNNQFNLVPLSFTSVIQYYQKTKECFQMESQPCSFLTVQWSLSLDKQNLLSEENPQGN